jgi:hypothetical protein
VASGIPASATKKKTQTKNQTTGDDFFFLPSQKMKGANKMPLLLIDQVITGTYVKINGVYFTVTNSVQVIPDDFSRKSQMNIHAQLVQLKKWGKRKSATKHIVTAKDVTNENGILQIACTLPQSSLATGIDILTTPWTSGPDLRTGTPVRQLCATYTTLVNTSLSNSQLYRVGSTGFLYMHELALYFKNGMNIPSSTSGDGGQDVRVLWDSARMAFTVLAHPTLDVPSFYDYPNQAVTNLQCSMRFDVTTTNKYKTAKAMVEAFGQNPSNFQIAVNGNCFAHGDKLTEPTQTKMLGQIQHNVQAGNVVFPYTPSAMNQTIRNGASNLYGKMVALVPPFFGSDTDSYNSLKEEPVEAVHSPAQSHDARKSGATCDDQLRGGVLYESHVLDLIALLKSREKQLVQMRASLCNNPQSLESRNIIYQSEKMKKCIARVVEGEKKI